MKSSPKSRRFDGVSKQSKAANCTVKCFFPVSVRPVDSRKPGVPGIETRIGLLGFDDQRELALVEAFSWPTRSPVDQQ